MTATSLLLLIATLGADSLGPGDHTRTLNVSDLKRSYLVRIPPEYDPKTPTPLVLAFHGGGANADTMIVFSGLNKKSDDVR